MVAEIQAHTNEVSQGGGKTTFKDYLGKFADVEAVKATLVAEQPQGFHILIKGSNGTHLSELPPLL